MYSNYQSYQHTVSARRIINGVGLGFLLLGVVAAYLLIH